MYCAIVTLLLFNGQNWSFEDLNKMELEAIRCVTTGKRCLKKIEKTGKYDITFTCEERK